MQLSFSAETWAGCLMGTLVGDSLGLPMEGLTPKRQHALFPPPWRQRLIWGRGMMSDDTEHSLMVVDALLRHPNGPEKFARRLAWGLRRWLLCLPAGTGMATARACLRLWMGKSPQTSGVYSAGNGAAMRVAPIGLFFAEDPQRLKTYVKAATRITHTDPKALIGAQAVALLTAYGAMQQRPDLATYMDLLAQAGDESEWLSILERLKKSLERDQTTVAFAAELGLTKGVSGYVYHTLPVVLHGVYRHWGDYEAGLISILECGGDSDTTAAIAGAILGAQVGVTGIPQSWRARVWDWPRSPKYITALSESLSRREPAPSYAWWGLPFRNLVFLGIVLIHGLRRLLPPY